MTHALKTQKNKSQVNVNERSPKSNSGKSTFQFTDNRPETIAQRKLKSMANSNTQTAQLQVIQMVKYVQTPTGKIKEVDDNYVTGWGEKFVDKPAERVPEQVPQEVKPVEKPAEVPAQTPLQRGYPLGFESLEQFRDLTRPIAQKHRDATVVVTGSSVTGKSGDGTREFRNNKTPKVKNVKKSGPSDIDLGIVKPGSVGKGQVDQTGFPKKKSGLSKLEKRYADSVEQVTGHPSGIKFFNEMPRGRSRSRERERIVREHTPEGQRIENIKEKEKK